MIWTEPNTQCTSGTFTIFNCVHIRNKRIMSTVYEPLTVEHHTITYGKKTQVGTSKLNFHVWG